MSSTYAVRETMIHLLVLAQTVLILFLFVCFEYTCTPLYTVLINKQPLTCPCHLYSSFLHLEIFCWYSFYLLTCTCIDTCIILKITVWTFNFLSHSYNHVLLKFFFVFEDRIIPELFLIWIITYMHVSTCTMHVFESLYADWQLISRSMLW